MKIQYVFAEAAAVVLVLVIGVILLPLAFAGAVFNQLSKALDERARNKINQDFNFF